MNKSAKISNVFVKIVILLALLISFSVSAQDEQDEEPTDDIPFSPVVPQASANLGIPNPQPIEAIIFQTGIDQWHQAGLLGTGRRVGVLDRGFGGLLNFEATQDVTVSVVVGGKASYDENTIIHGTQVLEVLHNVAPGAELFVCEYADFAGFNTCIDRMILNGVHIINHSAGVPALPLDGQGQWAQAVNSAADEGILWINAAGNFAQGYYRELFDDGNFNKLHEFPGNGIIEALGVQPLPGLSGVVMLSWDDGFDGTPANRIDIDLEVIRNDASGQIIAQSTNPQSGEFGHEALEYVVIDMSQPFAVRIIDNDGQAAGNVEFSLFVEFATLPGHQPLSSIIAPADAEGAVAVAALQENIPNAAPYSSQGPLTTGEIKPDLATLGEVLLSDNSSFIGTSAAAPVVAGAAALIWEANPGYSVNETRSMLLSFLRDGTNVNIGNGRLLMRSPLAVAPVVPSPTPTPTEAEPTPTFTAEATNTPVPPTPTPTRTPTSTPAILSVEDRTVFAARTGNVRSCASTDCGIVGVVQSGEEVTIATEREGQSIAGSVIWYEISVDGNRGFAHSSLFTTERTTGSAPVATAIPSGSSGTGGSDDAGEGATDAPASTGVGCSGGSVTNPSSSLFEVEGFQYFNVQVTQTTTLTASLVIFEGQGEWGVDLALLSSSGEIDRQSTYSGGNSSTTIRRVLNPGDYRLLVQGDSSHVYTYTLTWNCG